MDAYAGSTAGLSGPPVSGGGRAPVVWARWWCIRAPWLVAGLLLIVAGIGAALLLPPRADPFRPPATWVDEWFAPAEQNGWLRLPRIDAALLSIAIAPDGRIALAVGDRGTLLRSPDGGVTWAPVTSGTQAYLRSIAIAPDGRTALAVGDRGTLLRSPDGGMTWVPVTSGTRADLGSIAIAPDGRTALGAGGSGTLLRSPDGGSGRLLRSPDGGVTWAPVSLGMQADLLSIAIAPDGRTALAAEGSGTLLRSPDGGVTWAPVTSGTQAYLGSIAIAPDGRTALAAGWEGTLLRSQDGGASWAPVTSGTQANLLSIAMAPDGRTALAAGLGRTLLRSQDGGASWAPVAHYRRDLPRAAWVLWILGFIALTPGFVPLPSPIIVRDIGEIFASDRPLRKGDRDAAGTDALASQIAAFLRNPRTEPPLTIAVVGPWGSGKSSVLSRVTDDLREHGKRPVWFNAWHHQGEENLFAALLQAVRRNAVSHWLTLEGLEIRARLLIGRVRQRPVRALLGLTIVSCIAGLAWAGKLPSPLETIRSLRTLVSGTAAAKSPEPGWALLGGFTSVFGFGLALLLFVGGFRDRLKSAGLDPGKMMAAATRAVRWKDLGAQLGFRARFEEALSEVTEALGRRRRLTIVIDDLDRCRSAQIAEVLEAVNFISGAGGCFVLMGIAREQVRAGLGLAHAEMAKELKPKDDQRDERTVRMEYAEDFLRKLIQIEVKVPQFDAAAAAALMNVATDYPTKPPRDRAWMAAVWAALIFACVSGLFMGAPALHDRISDFWKQSEPKGKQVVLTMAQSIAPAQVRSVAEAKGDDKPPPSPQEEETRLVFVNGAKSSPSPFWLLWLVPALAAAALAALLHARRPNPTAAADSEEFVRALKHWSAVARHLCVTPREMKRFLNRLRFAAARGDVALPGGALVGLGVLAMADLELVSNLAQSGADFGPHVRRRRQISPWSEIYGKMDAAALSAAKLPPFTPDQDQAERFLRQWEGVKVRA